MVKDPGNQLSEASTVNLKGGKHKVKGGLNVVDAFDFYRVKLSGRSRFVCTLDQQEGKGELTLFDRHGKAIADADDRKSKLQSISRLLKAGLYFIGIKRTSSTIQYTLSSSSDGVVGSSLKEASQISLDQIQQGKTSCKGTVGGAKGEKFNFYQFQINGATTFSSVLQGLAANVEYEILNRQGKRIAFSTENSTTIESLSKLLAKGTYFIKIAATSERETNYELKLNFGTPEAVELVPSATTTGTAVYTKEVKALSSETYYKIDLSSTSNLDLNLSNLSADVNLELLSTSGSLLFKSTNLQTAQELINFNLEAGTYFVRVFPGVSNVAADFNLSFTSSAPKAGSLSNSVTLANGYRITYLGTDYIGSNSTWRYYMKELPVAQDLSNWVLELPSSAQVIGTSPKGELVNPDPNAQISGIKWQPGGGFVAGEFSVTLAGNVIAGQVDVAAKGPDVVVGQLVGPT